MARVKEPGRATSSSRSRDGQSRREGRQGRPPVWLHRAHRRGRRQRPGRLRLRQGPRGAGGDPEGDAAGAQEPGDGEPANATLHYRGDAASTARTRVFMQPASRRHGRDRGRRAARGPRGAGVRNVLAKSYGSRNPINVVRATMNALARVPAPGRSRRSAARPSKKLPVEDMPKQKRKKIFGSRC